MSDAVRGLVERGIQAYLAGRIDEARRVLEEAIGKDPANAAARSYLILIGGPVPGAPAASATPAPRRAPAPEAVAAARAQPDEAYAPSPWDEGPSARATIVVDAGGGLDLDAVAEQSDLRPLVSEAHRPATPPTATPRDVELWMQAARELFALGDFTGSLEMIEKILKVDPSHVEARDYLRQNEATLVAMYESKLGPLSGVPRLAIKPEEVLWLNLDHRAGFLLAQIDGTVAFEDLFALSGLPRLDTVKILATLMQDGVITA